MKNFKKNFLDLIFTLRTSGTEKYFAGWLLHSPLDPCGIFSDDIIGALFSAFQIYAHATSTYKLWQDEIQELAQTPGLIDRCTQFLSSLPKALTIENLVEVTTNRLPEFHQTYNTNYAVAKWLKTQNTA